MTTYSKSCSVYDSSQQTTYTCTVSGSYSITTAADTVTISFGNISTTWLNPRSTAHVKIMFLGSDNYVIFDEYVEAGQGVSHSPDVPSVVVNRVGNSYETWITVQVISDTLIETITIPALDTYTVTYYPNGGTGAPSAQTKAHGTNLTLSSVVPTRDDCIFKGWGTSPSTSSPSYYPGGTYAANASISLYAVWIQAYYPPSINSVDAYRCDSSGTSDDEGSYAAVEVTWAMCDRVTVGTWESYQTQSNNGMIMVTVNGVPASAAIGDSSGTTKLVVAAGLTADETASVSVIVRDAYGGQSRQATASTTIGTAFLTMDVLAGGHGISFGAPATGEEHNVSMPPKVYGELDLPVYRYSTLPAESSLPYKPCIVVLTTGEVYLAT